MFLSCFCKNREDNNLENVNYKDTIPFVAPVTSGKVIKVYDGDTITIASKLPIRNSPVYRFSVRLNGIDTPEMRTKNQNEKEIAQKAQLYLSGLIMNKTVLLKDVQTEKYGRLLAEVYIGKTHINKNMIANRYAVKYDGGTKQTPDDWKEYHYS